MCVAFVNCQFDLVLHDQLEIAGNCVAVAALGSPLDCMCCCVFFCNNNNYSAIKTLWLDTVWGLVRFTLDTSPLSIISPYRAQRHKVFCYFSKFIARYLTLVEHTRRYIRICDIYICMYSCHNVIYIPCGNFVGKPSVYIGVLRNLYTILTLSHGYLMHPQAMLITELCHRIISSFSSLSIYVFGLVITFNDGRDFQMEDKENEGVWVCDPLPRNRCLRCKSQCSHCYRM